VWFPFCFSVVRFEKTGSAKPNCDLPVDGHKGRVRVGKRFIFCRANLAVSANKNAATERLPHKHFNLMVINM
jgi:hypothetical protein